MLLHTSVCCHLSPACVTPGCNQNQFYLQFPQFSILLHFPVVPTSHSTAAPCSSPGLQDSPQEAQHPCWSRALGGSSPLTHSLKKLPAEMFCPCCPPDITESSQVNSSSKGRPCTGDPPLRRSGAEDTGKGLARMGPQIPTGRCP